MTDFRTLTDAFAELERRADEASAAMPADTAHHVPPRHRAGPLLIAASVVAVLAVVAAVALLARGRNAGTDAAAGPPTPTQRATHSASPKTSDTFQVPQTPAELARRFQVVLGGSATITVTDTGAPVQASVPAAPTRTVPAVPNHVVPGVPRHGVPATPTQTVPAVPNGSTGYQTALPASGEANGAAIVGTLTASGVTGGFDLQIFRDRPGGTAMCDDPDRSRCTVRRLADGSSLAVGREPLQGAAHAVTFSVDLIRPDGVEFLMHVSNERDPKGESSVLAAQPPLTTQQMTAIVTSSRW